VNAPVLSPYIEQFHLLFLVQLGRRLDKTLFIVKGGSNLRFFHRSIRCSEDLDLDLGEAEVHVVRDKVDEILGSRPFAQILEARGIRIHHARGHKQTETTQRWKLGLGVERAALPLPTRIEFSRRGVTEEVVYGSVDAALIRAYQLPPVMVSHYSAGAAFRQKVRALAERRETQARDIFDLHHLIASGAAAGTAGSFNAAEIERARLNAMAVDFGTFKSQVLAYLPPDEQPRYDSPPVWDTLVLEVVESLGGRGA
jgi:predicted nucleotidyltransferase component of viral defense system